MIMTITVKMTIGSFENIGCTWWAASETPIRMHTNFRRRSKRGFSGRNLWLRELHVLQLSLSVHEFIYKRWWSFPNLLMPIFKKWKVQARKVEKNKSRSVNPVQKSCIQYVFVY